MNNHNFENFNEVEARESASEVYNDGRENQVVHDDGFMHVEYNGQRYAFDIGQDVSSARYNSEANRILRSLGVSGQVSGRNN